MLFNMKNGHLTYDDELVVSHANDVQVKGLNNQKASKEGPVFNCVSCSITSILFVIRLRVTGETESKIIDQLLKTLPLKKENAVSKNSNTYLNVDQGYSKFKNVTVADSYGYYMSAFTASQGSNHPSIPLFELEANKKEWQTKVDSEHNKD